MQSHLTATALLASLLAVTALLTAQDRETDGVGKPPGPQAESPGSMDSVEMSLAPSDLIWRHRNRETTGLLGALRLDLGGNRPDQGYLLIGI